MFKIHHVAISVSDLESSIGFYENFGFVVKKKSHSPDKTFEIVLLELKGQILELFCFRDSANGGVENDLMDELQKTGVKHFSFVVDDIEQAKEMVLEKGLSSEVEIKDGITGVKYFFIKDPDGMFVEVLEEN
jgi:glyoxylase I family protein